MVGGLISSAAAGAQGNPAAPPAGGAPGEAPRGAPVPLGSTWPAKLRMLWATIGRVAGFDGGGEGGGGEGGGGGPGRGGRRG